jgi:peptide-methionine (S)-S-oxide reductase
MILLDIADMPHPKTLNKQPKNIQKQSNIQKAIFAAGCFWGVEESFRTQKGVIKTTVGYTGGHTKNPTYEQVCSHSSGHAETVLVEYDPKIISYNKLLKIFWDSHDPTQLNRQGPDIGTQYRSAIFYNNASQMMAALKSKSNLAKNGINIATEIVPASEFYAAEDYHQQYLAKKGLKSCN